ncbi:DUF3617 family protein [uncultured Desulfobacter sp.]|uniref:DUF3617 domain-containing protein n=1 Tax=uncultured Desulfobacter sp. TaxID=240139 RepID=UPI0029F4874A|nr:DUF3617 family protein [uncultured Desulfobacter sp.]
MLKKSIFIAFLSAIIFSPFSANCMDFKPGKYEITSKMEMQGMSMPAQTVIQCLTQEKPIPDKSSGNQGCEIVDMQENGNKLTWTMECMQEGQKVTSTGEMIYSEDSFAGGMTMETGPQAGNMTIKTQITGKRIGSCD